MVVGPAVEDLADLATVKSFILPGMGDQDDALLQLVLTSVSTWIGKELRRNLNAQQFVEVRNGTGMPAIWLWNSPILTISSVTFCPVPGGVQSPLSPQSYTWDHHQLILVGSNLGGYSRQVFPRGPKNITITYTAGWNTPGMYALSKTVSGAKDAPPELVLTCLELTALVYKGRDQIGSTGLGLGPERVNYFMGAMSARNQAILKLHMDVVPTSIE